MGFKWYDLLGPVGGAVGASLDKKEKKNIGKHALYGLGSNTVITGAALAAPAVGGALGLGGASMAGGVGKAVPLNPTASPNGLLSKGSSIPLKPITNNGMSSKGTNKSAFLQQASKTLGALGEGFSTQDNQASPQPFTPIEMNHSKGVVSNPIDLPQVSNMPRPQQTPMPVNRVSNYNALAELQKMIERQRAGY